MRVFVTKRAKSGRNGPLLDDKHMYSNRVKGFLTNIGGGRPKKQYKPTILHGFDKKWPKSGRKWPFFLMANIN